MLFQTITENSNICLTLMKLLRLRSLCKVATEIEILMYCHHAVIIYTETYKSESV